MNIIGSGFFVVSNVWWIQHRQYLEIIDILHTEREYTVRELEYMGIAAATLFPGVEGVCRALKEKSFA